MRFRLLQARTADDRVRGEERAQFAARLGVAESRVLPWDLLEGKTAFDAVTEGVDVVLVGGSGDFSVLDDEPWLRPFFDTLGELADRGFPTFASCFGFQGMVMALGGEVVHDPDNAEVGSFLLERAASPETPVFGELPERFWAQLGHKDRAARLPGGLRNLARSERCPFQAFQVDHKPVFATQFHPELNRHDNHGRYMRYYDGYVKALGQDAADEIERGFRDSPEANSLMRRFMEHLLGRDADSRLLV